MIQIVERELTSLGGPLAGRALESSRTSWTERRGLLLCLSDETGVRGRGEASPLPGYSPDGLKECSRALAELDLQRLALEETELDLEGLKGLSAPLASTPAARFALETALIELVSRHRNEPAWRTLRALTGAAPLLAGTPELELTALLPYGAPAEVSAAASLALARGIRTVKLKLGRPGEWAREIALLHRLREEFGAALTLRLDANQAWCPALARDRLAELTAFCPELVEEPANGLDGSADVRREALDALRSSPVPLALDESLAAEPVAELLAALGDPGTPLAALVLKPTTLGGLSRCIELAGAARRAGLDWIVTHTFDGPLALTAASALALALGGARPAGLDRHPGLAAYPPWSLPAHADGTLRGWSCPGFGAVPEVSR